MVKVTKMDRKKKNEQNKRKYKLHENLRYIFSEIWKSQPLMLILLLVGLIAIVAESLLTTFTGKYIVELALGTSSRVHLAVICLLLIVGERITKYIWNETQDYCGYYGNYKFACHTTRKIIRKNMSTDYENNESCKNSNAIQKAWVGSDYISYQTLNTMQYFLSAVLRVAAYGGILSMLNPVMLLIVGAPAIASYYIERHKMMWVWNMTDKWQKYVRELNYIHDAGGDFSYAKDVRVYGMDK